MERITFESFWLGCPAFDDVFIWRQAIKCLESASIIVCADEVSEMIFELPVAVIMIAFNGCLFDCSVHALDLAIGPRMLHFCEAMFDVVFLASHVKHVGHVSRCRTFCVTRGIGELHTVIG